MWWINQKNEKITKCQALFDILQLLFEHYDYNIEVEYKKGKCLELFLNHTDRRYRPMW